MPHPFIPRWLAQMRNTIYFVAGYWWAFTAGAVLLGLVLGGSWGQAVRWGLIMLALIVVSPGVLGVTTAVVSRSQRMRWEREHPGEDPPE